MRKQIQVGAIALILLCVGSGVSGAESVDLDIIQRSKTTADGWKITLTLDGASINSVPNMAAAPLVREGFINGTARLTVTDERVENPAMKVKTGLSFFAELGCQVDLAEGGSFELDTSLASSLPTLDLTPSPADVSLAPTGAISPQFTVNVKPGSILDPSLGTASYPPPQGLEDDAATVTKPLTVSVQDFHIVTMDQKCVGPVSIRLRVLGTIATPGSYETIEIFSDILPL